MIASWLNLQRFQQGLLQLVGDLLLPQQRRAHGFGLVVLLLLAAVSGSSLAALLMAVVLRLSAAILGPSGFNALFPYLGSLIPHLLLPWLALGVLLCAVATAVLLLLVRNQGEQARRYWIGLSLLVGLMVVSTAADVAFTQGNGSLFDALQQKDSHRFWLAFVGLSAIYGMTLPFQWLDSYGPSLFAIQWRKFSTAALQSVYLRNRNYYQLELNSPANLDNPDQRIADDIRGSVDGATSLFFGFSTSLLSFAAYILVLVKVSGWLVLTLLISTLLGNGSIALLVRRLANLTVQQQRLEANFRFALVHLRSHAEGLAFHRGEGQQARALVQRFRAVLRNAEQLVRWRSFVDQGTALYGFVMQLAPLLVLTGGFFKGAVSLGQLMVGITAFAQVQGALSFFILKADDLAHLFAGADRVERLRAACGEPAVVPTAFRSAISTMETPAAPTLQLRQMLIKPPGGRPLWAKPLNLSLESGSSLLVMGPSGCGKTSLLRTIAQLWPPLEGEVLGVPLKQMAFLPQRPYLPLGSLRDQLLVAEGNLDIADDALLSVLRKVKLDQLLERFPSLDIEENWEQVLSGGEQQRIAFARLLIQPKPLVLLDEATSALDLPTEAELYGQLLLLGGTVISVGHRSSLRGFHQHLLQFDAQGNWHFGLKAQD